MVNFTHDFLHVNFLYFKLTSNINTKYKVYVQKAICEKFLAHELHGFVKSVSKKSLERFPSTRWDWYVVRGLRYRWMYLKKESNPIPKLLKFLICVGEINLKYVFYVLEPL